ncbi:hypothetical protein GBAR_LOCUS11626 [Geodia barretti]|uniref:Uncharacterized protein n=1 Tax=Geodia barretti TaxID=519541 RepID=A0AA35WFA4_GEOBA|nr:hypothetical protein GBAR_LOCUS11626 [Geodia barretti]
MLGLLCVSFKAYLCYIPVVTNLSHRLSCSGAPTTNHSYLRNSTILSFLKKRVQRVRSGALSLTKGCFPETMKRLEMLKPIIPKLLLKGN